MTLAYLLCASDPFDPFTGPKRAPSRSEVGSRREDAELSRGSDSSTRDAVWLERIHHGDRSAFAELYREYLTAMLGFAFRIVRSVAVAEDLCADVFVAVWERREDWAPRYSVRAYLFHAVRSRALNYLRDQATADRLQHKFADEWRELGTASVTPIDERLDVAQKLAAVRSAIAQMPDTRRRVMELRWQHGMAIEEVAAIMEISRAAVDQHLSRGLRTLHQVLPSTFEDAPGR